MLSQENPVASGFGDIPSSLALTVLCMCAHVHARTAQTLAVSVSGYSWCKCAGRPQAGMCAPGMWVGAILLLGGNSFLFLSFPGVGAGCVRDRERVGYRLVGVGSLRRRLPV